MYRNIEKEFDLAAADLVTKKRKSPLPAILLTAAGLLVAFLHKLVPAVAGNADLSSSMIIIGWIIVVAGITRLVISMAGNSWEFYYKPTGEKLRRHELSFDNADKGKVLDCVTSGNFEKLASIGRSNISAVKVSFYATAGRNVLWAQVLEFIPHTHEPITDIIAFEKGKCIAPAALV